MTSVLDLARSIIDINSQSRLNDLDGLGEASELTVPTGLKERERRRRGGGGGGGGGGTKAVTGIAGLN
jgi:hypothetical protein